jgi:hypothetical protein
VSCVVVQYACAAHRPSSSRACAGSGSGRHVGWDVGRADVDTLTVCCGLLHDLVDGGGVYDCGVHGGSIDIVQSHDLEAQGFSLRLILLRRTDE